MGTLKIIGIGVKEKCLDRNLFKVTAFFAVEPELKTLDVDNVLVENMSTCDFNGNEVSSTEQPRKLLIICWF